MPDDMPDFDWYATGEFDDLQQGDFFPNCPIVQPNSEIYQQLLAAETGDGTVPIVEATGQGTILYASVIVLSHSCDLAKQDCTQVLVCVCQNAMHYSKEQRSQIAKDRMPALHMIEACDSENIQFPQQVIDFRAIYTLPKDFLLGLAKARGKRARLLPPYREHLAQAFARFFMRVGLPRNLKSE